jgi:hypothetical protein
VLRVLKLEKVTRVADGGSRVVSEGYAMIAERSKL